MLDLGRFSLPHMKSPQELCEATPEKKQERQRGVIAKAVRKGERGYGQERRRRSGERREAPITPGNDRVTASPRLRRGFHNQGPVKSGWTLTYCTIDFASPLLEETAVLVLRQRCLSPTTPTEENSNQLNFFPHDLSH